MKIALLNDYLDPQNWGGASRVAAEQAHTLLELGHDVMVVGASDSLEPLPGIRHHAWKALGGLRGLFKLRREVQDVLKSFRPDRVIIHQPLVGFFALKHLANIDTRYFFHSSWADEASSRGKTRGVRHRRQIEKQVMSRCRKVYITSEFTRCVLENVDASLASQAILNPLAVRTPPFDVDARQRLQLRQELGLADDSLLVCTFRRLVSRTGVDLFIEALALCPNMIGLIGGVGELSEELKQLAQNCGVTDRLHFLGYVSNQRLVQILQASDLAVTPSKELEGFGLFTLEALACGCPVVVTPVGNNPALLQSLGLSGVAQDLSPASLADAMRTEITCRHDPQQLHSRVTQTYNWTSHVEALLC